MKKRTEIVEVAFESVVLPQASLTPVSMTLPAKLSEAAWIAVGKGLGQLEQARQWWIGDWWAFADDEGKSKHKYGDRKALVESDEWNGPAYNTCVWAAVVCRTFESMRRRILLSFEHHKTLASRKLKPALVDELLDWCEEPLKNGAKKPRSVRQLEEEVVKRENNVVYDRVIRGLEKAIQRRDQDKKLKKADFDELYAALVLALTNLVNQRTAERICVTETELQILRDQIIDEKLGEQQGNLIMLIEFIDPIRKMAERTDFDFDEMIKAESTVMVDEDIESCRTALRLIQNFIDKAKALPRTKPKSTKGAK